LTSVQWLWGGLIDSLYNLPNGIGDLLLSIRVISQVEEVIPFRSCDNHLLPRERLQHSVDNPFAESKTLELPCMLHSALGCLQPCNTGSQKIINLCPSIHSTLVTSPIYRSTGVFLHHTDCTGHGNCPTTATISRQHPVGVEL